ncbi:MAG: HNH endonuclease [Syntrophaceae bacterium]|nr:HNH endonuclease [Syntrophaceae bacterium]
MRENIPKKIRFEVFKRDSFKCQYCGAAAPEVLLHIDHIKPVSEGGSNDITNLVTACSKCNLGKSNVPLDDKTFVMKSRNQLEELSERREQLEMMMQWHESLQDIKNQLIENISTYWESLAKGYSINENGLKIIKKLSREYTYDEITTAMDIAAEQYLKFDKDGNCTDESWNIAFNKINRICGTRRLTKDKPEMKDLFYIRGILKNKIRGHFDGSLALSLLKNAYDNGVTLEELRRIALESNYWDDFEEALNR